MTPAELQAKKLAEYLDELAKVKDSLMSTCNDLVKDLAREGLAVEALRADEASSYLRASLTSLERLLVARIGPRSHRDH